MARTPFLFLLITVCASEAETSPVEKASVDLLEVNTFYDCQCRPVFQQVIAWKKMPDTGKLHNVGWKMITSDSETPVKQGSSWTITVASNGFAIRVQSRHIRWSHSQVDPERIDSRDYWQGSAPNIFQPREARQATEKDPE